MRNLILLFSLLLAFATTAFAAEDSAQTTSEPTVLYSWFNAAKFPKFHYDKKIKLNDTKAGQYISNARLSQWIATSPSPVTLRQQGSQGGDAENWVLIEISVRPGFRTIEATSDFLGARGCPSLNAQSAPSSCLKALEEATTFAGIDGLKLKTGEIILANGKYFHPSEIRVFNHLSSEAPQDRLKIQSLFYKADLAHFKLGSSDSLFPAEISRLNPPFSGGGRGLLWDDLDGKPLDLSTEQSH